MSRCPTHQQLEDLLEEHLGEAEARAVTAHVGKCGRCQDALERLSGGADEDEARLSSVRLAAPAPPTTAFLDRLKQAPPFPGAGRPAGPEKAGPPAVPGYEIAKELGRGGMGVVYQARHLGLNRPVALKMILAGGHAGPKDLARFRQEAEAVARLRHPNIIQIYDIGEADGRPYFALELVEEGSLVRRLRGEPQPVFPTARLIETLARATHYAHQNGIVHRDLKPANILLVSGRVVSGGVVSGESSADTTHHSPLTTHQPKITDFGLARRLDDQASGSPPSEVVGTPSYMAPEQAQGRAQAAGPAADVYALGAILYEMLTGRPPFKGATAVDTLVQVMHEEPLRPSRLRPKVPRDLETICLKCLQKDPRKRYTSAEALADDLRRFRQGKPILARPVGALERSWKWARRRPLTAALLAGMLVSVVLGFAGVTWQWRVAADARDVAVAEKQEAERLRRIAEEARQRAGRDRERSRRALYYSRISQTQLQWRVNDLAGAERSLARCVPDPGRPDRRGWEWHYLSGLFHAELLTLSHPQGGLGASVAVAPDGRYVASVVGGYPPEEREKPGEVRLWDAADGRLLHAIPGPGTLHRLAVAPDGKRLAVGATDGTVRILDAATGREALRRALHTQAVTGLAYNPAGDRLATAGWDRTVKISDAATGAVLHVLRGHGHKVQSVAFHPRGDRVASGDWDGEVRIWSSRGDLLATWHQHKSAVYCVAFSPDGKLLASAGSNGNIKVAELATGKVVQSLTGHAGAVLSVAFSPDGRSLAYGGGDSTVRVWDVEAGLQRIIFRGHTAAVEEVHFSPDGQRLVSVSPGRGMVKVWDLTDHPEHATFARTGADVEAIAFPPGGRQVVSVTVGGRLQTWDADTGVLQTERRLPLSEQEVSPGVPVCFAPGAARLAGRSRQDPALVKSWDVATGAETAVFRGHTLPVTCVHFSADGRRLATAGCDLPALDGRHEIMLWDAASGRRLATRTGTGPLYTLAFRPDGRRLATGRAGGFLTVLDGETGAERLSFRGHQGEVTALAYSPDGRFLASGGLTDRSIKVWDLTDAKEARSPSRRPVYVLAAPSFVCDLAFSPDGKRLAAVSRDLVRVWDAEVGQELLTLRGAPQRHWDPPFNPRILFSPDGRRLAGTNWDESISIWDGAPQADEAAVARRQEARRRAADRRALFWHLQEAESCLAHKNRSAALFHFRRLGNAPLPGPLQERKEKLAMRLKSVAGKEK